MDVFAYYGFDWVGLALCAAYVRQTTRGSRYRYTLGVSSSVCLIVFGVLSGSIASCLANSTILVIHCHALLHPKPTTCDGDLTSD